MIITYCLMTSIYVIRFYYNLLSNDKAKEDK